MEFIVVWHVLQENLARCHLAGAMLYFFDSKPLNTWHLIIEIRNTHDKSFLCTMALSHRM